MKHIKAIVRDKDAIFQVPTVQEYERCLKENKGLYDKKKMLKKHGNIKSS